ncbi:unnamed protein product [Phytophthora lilii]|uniref:Unnamed protein product n=1 Tax=Phytophthora lilii TaxID=2077276 RepID=A0A9W6YJQ0_9STRA|nr:unnamed protein product [Phytophthora lilii]
MVRVITSTCVFAALVASAASHNPAYIYKFDAANAAGVDGSIQVKYAGEDSSTATITASLDFSGVDQAEIAAFDGNCTEAVTSYKWHIHTKWNSTLTSDSFKQCSKAATDNHYDPLRACGTASEYIAEPECKAKSLNYACNPANYMNDPLACEKGDLSGKFGAFKLSEDSTVSADEGDHESDEGDHEDSDEHEYDEGSEGHNSESGETEQQHEHSDEHKYGEESKTSHDESDEEQQQQQHGSGGHEYEGDHDESDEEHHHHNEHQESGEHEYDEEETDHGHNEQQQNEYHDDKDHQKCA